MHKVKGAEMQKIKALLAAGARLTNAVQDALGDRSIARVALEHGVNRQNLTQALTGNRVATRKEIEVLVAELGGEADEWRDMLADVVHARAMAV